MSLRAHSPRVKSRSDSSNPLQGQPSPTPRASFTFAMVPTAVAGDPGLSPGGKLLFGVILSLSKGAWGRCFARNEALAEMTGLCVKQVLRLLRDLEKRGLIRRVMDGNRRLEIEVTWTPAQGQIVPTCTPAQGQIVPMDGDNTTPPSGQNVPPYEISEEKTEDEFAGGENPAPLPENPEILRGPWADPGPPASPPVAPQARPGPRYPESPEVAAARRLRANQARQLVHTLAVMGRKLVRDGESLRLVPLNPLCPPSGPLPAWVPGEARDLKPELLALLGP